MNPIVYEDTLPAGCHWSLLVPAGFCIRLTDAEGGANVGMLMYNPVQWLERINIPDTLKCQHTFILTKGHCIYSDMGRIFCSIIKDDFKGHDSVCGAIDRDTVESRWGKVSYQQARNNMQRNGRDGFLIELAKQGLGKRDMAANINWFSRVDADESGNIRLAKNTLPGAEVELMFEMDTWVVLQTCPHPLDTSAEWPAKPVKYSLLKYDEIPAGRQDILWDAENQRGLLNNRLYTMACCHHETTHQ